MHLLPILRVWLATSEAPSNSTSLERTILIPRESRETCAFAFVSQWFLCSIVFFTGISIAVQGQGFHQPTQTAILYCVLRAGVVSLSLREKNLWQTTLRRIMAEIISKLGSDWGVLCSSWGYITDTFLVCALVLRQGHQYSKMRQH